MNIATRMRLNRANPAEVVLARLKRLASLSVEDEALVLGLSAHRHTHAAGAEIFGEGHLMRRPQVLLSGWACRQRALSDGRRQIFAFLLPGDALGLCARPEPLALANTISLTRSETADARSLADALEAGSPRHAGLDAAFAMAAALEEAWLLDHLMRVGRQTAYERTAHLLLEFHWRLSMVGLTEGWRYHMPLTQEVLSDALGLSVVHMNRTLQQLRREGRVAIQSGEVELLQPDLLAQVADFNPPRPSDGGRPPPPLGLMGA